MIRNIILSSIILTVFGNTLLHRFDGLLIHFVVCSAVVGRHIVATLSHAGLWVELFH